jgi:hypothetical protein
MNIQNIIRLSEQLKALGFADLGYLLAKRICFKPKRFVLDYQVEKNNNLLNFQLSFETDCKSNDSYTLVFYDAVFQQAKLFEGSVNGVDVSLLSQQMSEVDWKKAFDFTEKGTIASNDKNAFEREVKIEAIVEDLSLLGATSEGKYIANFLKQAFWSGAAYHNIYGNLSTQKNKDDVCQRFYVLEGQPGISVDEAYRYLQNRWLEKEMLSKKRNVDSSNNAGGENDGYGTGLLKKRRRRKTRASKSEK